MKGRRQSFSSVDNLQLECGNVRRRMKIPSCFVSSFKLGTSKIKVRHRPLWNSSTRLDRMNDVIHNGSLGSIPVTNGTPLTPGPPINAFDNNNTKKIEKCINHNNDDHNDVITGIKIYNLWSRKLSKDQVSSEITWNRCRRLANDALGVFVEKLVCLEKTVSDDVACLYLLDLDAVSEKKRVINEAVLEVDELDAEFKEVSKAFQNVGQFLPPSTERNDFKARISEIRKRYFTMLEALVRKKEIFRWLEPLLQKYKDLGTDIKNWLDGTEVRSELFISNYNNPSLMLENEEAIKNLYEELCEQKDVYENFLEAGEGILDLNKEQSTTELRRDLDDAIHRWDSLVSDLEKCLNRLKVAKQDAEERKKHDTDRIENKIRSEAQLCTCHKPFQIIKVGDGKYTFGTSKIVRLVRIHGNSIVVRVGGGWEFLYDFLLKADPCRAKQIRENPKRMSALNLSGLDLTPMDKNKGEHFSLSVQRMTQNTWSPSYRNRVNRSGSLGSAASSDNIDGCDESSDSNLSSSTSGSSAPQSRSHPRMNFSLQKSNSRKYSYDHKMTGSVDTLHNKKTSNRRISLIERQSEYAEKQKISQAFAAERGKI